MLSNKQKKYVNALKLKKHRIEQAAFVVEGEKMVKELLNSNVEVTHVFGTESIDTPHFIAVTEKELAAISSLKTPHKFLAVARQNTAPSIAVDHFTIALDNIQDPGNLGTIIRIADWFGIKHIVCSLNSVDVFNPKVIQATMGSLFRVHVHYVNLLHFFNQHKGLNVYGAVLNGKNIYKTTLEQNNTVLLMGNESKGISENLKPFITHPISIPQFGGAESLNVAAATAILCAEYRRTEEQPPSV